MTHLYNSNFTGWESELMDNEVLEPKPIEKGFNCKLPFFKSDVAKRILFSFQCKQNISIEASLLTAHGELLMAVEKSYHLGDYVLTIDISNMDAGLHFLSIKSIGKFKVTGIKIVTD